MSDPYECFSSNQNESFLEFCSDPLHGHGFSLAQLIHYTIEPAQGELGTAPKQRLALAFSTADVILTGWNLHRLTEAIRAHKGGIVKLLPGGVRYQKLETYHAAVTKIEIIPVTKE